MGLELGHRCHGHVHAGSNAPASWSPADMEQWSERRESVMEFAGMVETLEGVIMALEQQARDAPIDGRLVDSLQWAPLSVVVIGHASELNVGSISNQPDSI